MSDTNLSKRIVEEIIELGEEIKAIKGLSTQPYLFSHEAKEIRIYPEETAPELEAREDGVLYLCETKEETDIDPMKVYIGKGIEVVANDVSYGKIPLNEGSWGKKELFAPKESKEDEKPKDEDEDKTKEMAMVLVCKIPSANYALDLSPWLSAAPGDGTTDISIDWGDKSAGVDYSVTETPGNGTITHTFATAGEYRITLKGSFKWGLGKLTSNLALQSTLTSIELPSGKSPIKYVATYAFYDCDTLTSIPEGLFDNCTEVTDFSYCFRYCSALTSIPTGLFDNCTAVTDFSYCFFYCYALTSALPTLWISHASASHTYCFRNCTKATNYADAQAARWV